MRFDNILTLSEGQTFACFSLTTEPLLLAQTMSAMAHADGGMIALGISSKTHIIEGIDGYDDLVESLLKEASNLCKIAVPYKRYKTSLTAEYGTTKHLLILHISASSKLHECLDKECYVRCGSNNIKLSFDERMQLLYNLGTRQFENKAVCDATLEDLNLSLVSDYLKHTSYHKSAYEYLCDYDFISTDSDGKESVSSAAILLFAKNPQRFFPRARTRFIRYEGTSELVGTQMNVVKDVIFEGTILKQVEQALFYLETQVIEHTYLGEQGRFITDRNYSKEAIRELVVNSICHRDYSIKGTEIQIKLFDDRLVFETPGELPDLISADNMGHKHFLRNPKIANFLKDYGYVTEFGEGIASICEERKAKGLALPTFKQNAFILQTTLMAEWQLKDKIKD